MLKTLKTLKTQTRATVIMTDQRGSGPKGPNGPRAPMDGRISREIVRPAAVSDPADALPRGMRELARHAQQLARTPVRESTDRFSRELLLAAAMRKAPARALGFEERANPFGGKSVWARFGLASLAQRPYVSGFALVVLASALLLGYLQLDARSLGTLPLAAATPQSQAHEEGAPLSYSSSGGQPAASNYLVAPAHDSASLHFSDGSEITAAPGTRLRVDSTQANGARVLLEDGSARARITHREHTSWKLVAGPFDVRITGTAFTLAWDAADQVLDLTLHEGSVEVESPLGATHLKVKTGQRFHASVTDGTMQLLAADAPAASAERAQEPSAETAVTQPVTQPRAKSSEGRARRLSAHKAGRRLSRAERRANAASARNAREDEEDGAGDVASASYADLVRAGAFEQVVTAATQAGLAQTLEHDSAENVRALADAARYLHRTELAVRSLTVLRTRFPGTHHSAAAAFLLGRTYENAEQPAAARRFYELYERESPSGEFAAEALAGRMRTVASLEGASAGRAIAEQYLERYPRGVHAKTAKQLLH